MNRSELCILLISVCLGASGQVFLKAGALKIFDFSHLSLFPKVIAIMTIPELIVGLVFYGLAAVTYIILLSVVDLGIAAPAASLVYVFSVLFGILFFQESITYARLCGISLIFAGVIMIAQKK